MGMMMLPWPHFQQRMSSGYIPLTISTRADACCDHAKLVAGGAGAQDV